MISRFGWSVRAQLAAAASCALAGTLADEHRTRLSFFLFAAMFLPLSVVLSAGAATLALLGVIGLHAAYANDAANDAANGASDTATGLALVLYARALLLVMLALRRAAEEPATAPEPVSDTVPAPRPAGPLVGGDGRRRRPGRAILSLTLTIGLITTCMVTLHLRRRRRSSAFRHLTGRLDA